MSGRLLVLWKSRQSGYIFAFRVSEGGFSPCRSCSLRMPVCRIINNLFIDVQLFVVEFVCLLLLFWLSLWE